MPHAQMQPARTLLFMGRPGSGKETQARLLAEKIGFHVMSTGEKFRELREHRNALGEHIRAEYDAGRLIPDWFADYLTQEALVNLSPEAGIIFEGSGRTEEQAKLFHEVTGWLGRPYRVINLVISEDEAERRQIARSKVANRPDSDTQDKIRLRFKAYDDHTVPAIDFFKTKNIVIDIDGERTIEEIHKDIMIRFGMS